MINVGILRKSDSKFLFRFPSKTVKLHKDYSDSTIYVAFELDTSKNHNAYYWDGSQVLYDETYAPTPVPNDVIAKDVVYNAIDFGTILMKEFAAENVTMGITQAGKTAEVLAVMEEKVEIDPINKPNINISVMGTITSGSLYETINVINVLINRCNNAEYDNLNPFITTNRLTEFKSKIETYLGL